MNKLLHYGYKIDYFYDILSTKILISKFPFIKIIVTITCYSHSIKNVDVEEIPEDEYNTIMSCIKEEVNIWQEKLRSRL